MSEWFVDWFNTDEYLEVYKHRNETEAEKHINFILSNVSLKYGASILDLACGSGRHSILLSKMGYDVTGVDLSDRLLQEAILNAQAENLKINFIKSDIREFYTDRKFDLVLNLFTSFGYFDTDDENFSVFIKAHNFLEKRGFFILDYFNKDYLVKNLISYSEEQNDKFELIQRRKIENDRVVKEIIINKNGSYKTFIESVKLYDSSYLQNKLKEIGFDIINLFGDFSGNNFITEESPRFIAICQKL